MAFIRFTCQQNEFLEELHRTYKITPMAVPDSKTQPLMAIAHRGQKTQLLGPLADLLQDGSILSDLTIYKNESVELNTKKTGSFNAELGLNLLKGFWKTIVPDSEPVEIETALQKAAELSLSFEGVQQRYFFPFSLGSLLAKTTLVPNDHANMYLFTRAPRPMDLFVIDSIFECNRFVIDIEKQKEIGTKVNAADLASSIGAVGKIKIRATGKNSLSFESETFLTFGFSCVHLPFDKVTGKLKIGETTIWAKERTGGNTTEQVGLESISLMDINGLGMFSWDEEFDKEK